MSLLYIDEDEAKIGIQEHRFHIEYPDGLVRKIPVESVDSITILGNSRLTTQCIKECLQRGIAVANLLLGYGFRIQKSAFEAKISVKKYQKLLSELEPYGNDEDSVRIYKIIGKGQVTCYGRKAPDVMVDDVILV